MLPIKFQFVERKPPPSNKRHVQYKYGGGHSFDKNGIFPCNMCETFHHFIQHTKTTELIQPHPQCSQVVVLFFLATRRYGAYTSMS